MGDSSCHHVLQRSGMFGSSVAKLGENEWQITYLMPLPTSKVSVVGPGACC